MMMVVMQLTTFTLIFFFLLPLFFFCTLHLFFFCVLCDATNPCSISILPQVQQPQEEEKKRSRAKKSTKAISPSFFLLRRGRRKIESYCVTPSSLFSPSWRKIYASFSLAPSIQLVSVEWAKLQMSPPIPFSSNFNNPLFIHSLRKEENV